MLPTSGRSVNIRSIRAVQVANNRFGEGGKPQLKKPVCMRDYVKVYGDVAWAAGIAKARLLLTSCPDRKYALRLLKNSPSGLQNELVTFLKMQLESNALCSDLLKDQQSDNHCWDSLRDVPCTSETLLNCMLQLHLKFFETKHEEAQTEEYQDNRYLCVVNWNSLDYIEVSNTADAAYFPSKFKIPDSFFRLFVALYNEEMHLDTTFIPHMVIGMCEDSHIDHLLKNKYILVPRSSTVRVDTGDDDAALCRDAQRKIKLQYLLDNVELSSMIEAYIVLLAAAYRPSEKMKRVASKVCAKLQSQEMSELDGKKQFDRLKEWLSEEPPELKSLYLSKYPTINDHIGYAESVKANTRFVNAMLWHAKGNRGITDLISTEDEVSRELEAGLLDLCVDNANKMRKCYNRIDSSRPPVPAKPLGSENAKRARFFLNLVGTLSTRIVAFSPKIRRRAHRNAKKEYQTAHSGSFGVEQPPKRQKTSASTAQAKSMTLFQLFVRALHKRTQTTITTASAMACIVALFNSPGDLPPIDPSVCDLNFVQSEIARLTNTSFPVESEESVPEPPVSFLTESRFQDIMQCCKTLEAAPVLEDCFHVSAFDIGQEEQQAEEAHDIGFDCSAQCCAHCQRPLRLQCAHCATNQEVKQVKSPWPDQSQGATETLDSKYLTN